MFLVLYEYDYDKNKQFFILKTDDLTGIEGQQDKYKMFISTDKDVDDIEELFYDNLNSSVSSLKRRGNKGYIVELKNKNDYGFVLQKIISVMTSFINYELQSKKNKDENPREQITFVIETSSSDESDESDESESNESDDTDYIENEFAVEMRKKVINRFKKYFKYSRNKKNTYDANLMYRLVSPCKMNSKLKSNLVKKIIKNILEDIDVSYDKNANVFTNVKCLY
jgi:hypothetical protein